MKKKHMLLGVVLACVVTGVFVAFILSRNMGTEYPGVELKSYNPDGICDALIPGCGYCPGEIIDDRCFVDETDPKVKPFLGGNKGYETSR